MKKVKDVLIVGGGVMGSSAAYHLAKKAPNLKITVLERSFAYKRASAVLSAGGIRMQFSERPNIEMSQYGIHFLKNAGELLHVPGHDAVDVQFTEGGSVNAKVALMTPAELTCRFPWLDTTGIARGSLGLQDEGWFDPWSYLTGLKRANLHLGVEYVEGTVVAPMAKTKGHDHIIIDHVTVATSQGQLVQFAPGHVVNAAGAWAHDVAVLAGVSDLPVRARKRTVFVFHCPEAATWTGTMASPLVIDPSGVYFRREGAAGQFICGVSPAAADDHDCDGEDLLQPDHALFDDVIWPTLAARVPAFNKLKVVNAWAGFYDFNTFDHNAIVGRHPDVANLLCINGFSGHGLQQSPAAGRAIAELIVDGDFTSLDLTCFGFDRIRNDKPYFEQNIV
ncbi:hypothetical protein DYB28_006760 [Aphanomyces astaci]|uniref:FAD-dependent oxidoreductase domain-containing protein 1 n=1 Tax=Aphanomyces astaci TaxID=112090 RepID=A0A9X8H2K2_APHAT|nr:hypothetical protein DYB28_006760 [Aphanomyces astaci]